MSQSVKIKMSRFERTPWGFRLHGGADFGTPLLIQKVNPTSLSEEAGLQGGDVLLAVNGQDVQNLRHKEAQDVIVRAGNNFEMLVQRGGVLNQALRSRDSETPVKQVKGGLMSGNGPAPTVTPPKNWSKVLDANNAGVADSAEEFTKQFMSQLKGDTAANLPAPMNQAPKLNGQNFNGQSMAQPTSMHHSRTATPTRQVKGGLMSGNGPTPAVAPPKDWSKVLDANNAGIADSAEEFTKQFMSQLKGDTASNLPAPMTSAPKVNGQSMARPTSMHNSRTATPTRQMQHSSQPVQSANQGPTLHKVLPQYNTPMSLYSEDTLKEVLDQQAEVLGSGVKGINFVDEPDLPVSETLKLVHELDTRGPEPEPGGHPRRFASPSPANTLPR